MQFFTYWVKQTESITVDGQPSAAVFYGKSNVSEDDARREAHVQARAVQARIDGRKSASEVKYDVPIREEIVEHIDSHNIVTRNRYGALVLNSEDLLFIDIDRPRFGFFRSLFRKPKGTLKEQILTMVTEKASKTQYRNMAFRIYETRAGVRVIVQGIKTVPVDKGVMALMSDFNADHLYATLCRKQQCYRARLTPKPSRIKCRTPRVSFPRSADEAQKLDTWIENYNSLARPFAVCRHIRDIGRFRENSGVRYHDTQTKSRESLPLA